MNIMNTKNYKSILLGLLFVFSVNLSANDSDKRIENSDPEIEMSITLTNVSLKADSRVNAFKRKYNGYSFYAHPGDIIERRISIINRGDKPAPGLSIKDSLASVMYCGKKSLSEDGRTEMLSIRYDEDLAVASINDKCELAAKMVSDLMPGDTFSLDIYSRSHGYYGCRSTLGDIRRFESAEGNVAYVSNTGGSVVAKYEGWVESHPDDICHIHKREFLTHKHSGLVLDMKQASNASLD